MAEKIISGDGVFKALARDQFYKVETAYIVDSSNQKIPVGDLSILDEKENIYMPLSLDGTLEYTFNMEMQHPSREFKLFIDNLVGKGIRARSTPISISGLFFNSEIKDFLERVETDKSIYLEKGNTYTISDCHIENDKGQPMLTVTFKAPGGNFDMHIINSNIAHIRRLENFFKMRIHTQRPIVPRENISPVITSSDINALFSAIDPYEPRLVKGKAYKLKSIIRREAEDTVMLELMEYGNMNPILYPISTYGDSANADRARSLESVASYFERKLSSNGRLQTFITPAIDIYDNMLDFMQAEPEVSVLKFGIIEMGTLWTRGSIRKFVQESQIPWNVSYTTTWGGIRKKFYPDAVP